MNWFTKDIVSASSDEHKQALLNQDGGCEHVEKNVALGHAVHKEMDTFGPVSTFLCCKACHLKAKAEEGQIVLICQDCKNPVKRIGGILWRWYDFNAAQGDKAIFVCASCQGQHNHRVRVSRDAQAYVEEFGEEQ